MWFADSWTTPGRSERLAFLPRRKVPVCDRFGCNRRNKEARERIAKAERRLANKLEAGEKRRVSKDLERDRKLLAQMQKQNHHLEVIQKQLQHKQHK